MKILVIDDHPLILEALRQVLRMLDESVEVLEAQSHEEGRARLDAHPDVDLVLLDLTLPGTTGLDGLAELREAYPSIPVVVLSANDSRDVVMGVIEGGAMGFIPKTSATRVLVGALRLVLSGGVYLPQSVLDGRDVLGGGAHPRSGAAAAVPSAAVRASPEDLGITPRQAEVLALLVQGKPNKVICRDLDLAEGTVKIHVTQILKALNVANRTQAVIAVSRLGLMLPPVGGREAAR